MRLVRFKHLEVESYGVWEGDHVICLPKLAIIQRQSLPSTLNILIQNGIEETGIERQVEDASKLDLDRASLPIRDLRFLAPISRPPKIICLGLNYVDHAEEQGKSPPHEPVIFMKPHTTIIGPNENIVKPKRVKHLDYEGELAIVIGRKCKNIPVEAADSYIFGYTILNDVSARDIQFKDKQWTRAKSFDTFAPTGPCITTSLQMRDLSNLSIRTWVNHEIRQDSTTSKMVLNTFEIVYHLSQVMTLEPTDIIATGTPAGVGFAMKPEPKFLQSGDVVKIKIEGIGTLINRVAQETY
jgi:2-keto-4-pentenoate hydratase/2-oxohepta-3-ene-1,7-dioic acid hydratase in catechol pathway